MPFTASFSPVFVWLRGTLAAVALAGTPAVVAAQATGADSTATQAASCGPLQPVELCVDFDASRSVDPGAGPLSTDGTWAMVLHSRA
ncbi:hypothetical protein [Hymenobacter sp. BRD67]|uniref:hypothetical protein n=1 Tax=Hymenobacter sp. BRD67 TaxID=2675877 RepID=UPI001564F9FE|nr:hypothetical protein [Hymenobacter sp. BRD67]QKG53640.1 hypothetical protein GKZ67_14815 [Hymenobacter sp. BRD67]